MINNLLKKVISKYNEEAKVKFLYLKEEKMDKMDEFGKRLEDAGKKFFKKTKEFADATKLSIKLKDLEIDLERLYQTAGENAYKKLDNKEAFEAIKDKCAKIEIIKAEIAEARGMKICSNCKVEMPKEAVACMKCGHKFK